MNKGPNKCMEVYKYSYCDVINYYIKTESINESRNHNDDFMSKLLLCWVQ